MSEALGTVASLLVACARIDPAPDADLPRGLDWGHVLDEGEHHNVIPMLHRFAETANGVPNEVRSELRSRSRAIAEEMLLLTGSLVDLCRGFQETGLVAVPFKGPVLARLAYGDVGLRYSLDLDLVVGRDSVLEAKRLLEERGFEGGPVSRTMISAWVRHGRAITMYGRDGLVVDLQWAGDLSESIRMPEVMARLGSIELGGMTLPSFAIEDHVHLLCIHGAKHLWSHLFWIADVAHLVAASPDLDWRALLERSQRAHTLRRVLLGMELAGRLGAPLPEPVARLATRDRWVLPIADQIWGGLAGPHRERFPLSRWHLRMRDSASDALAYAGRLAATPTDDDWEWHQLPGGLWWLYPALRPFRLGSKYAGHLLRRRGTDVSAR